MTNLYKIVLCCTILLLTEGHYCLAQTNTSPKSENPEYKQYKYLADAYFNEGDYEKATRLYRLCLSVPTHDKDTYATERMAVCQRITTAQKSFDNALKTKPDVNPELQVVKQALAQNPKDMVSRQRLAVQLEQDGDARLQRGDYEGAVNRYAATQEVTPTKSVAFKMEKANEAYQQKVQKPLPQYQAYQQNPQKPKPNPQTEQRRISIAAQNEYTRYRDEADAALKSGNYDLARRKYIAATQVPSYEGDRYVEEQTSKIARLKNLNKRLEETQNDPRGQLIYTRDALALNPEDASLRTQAAQAAVQVGDEMLSKGLFADAKKYYQEAEKYGANGMNEKIADANTKIQDKRDEIAKTKAALAGGDNPGALTIDKPTKQRNAHRERPTLVGVAITAGASTAFPILNNGSSNVKTPTSLQWYGGGQFIVLPDAKFSPIVGVNYAPVRFQTADAAKTIPLERFAFDLLQIPVGLRYNYSMSNEDFSLHLEAGATLNLPRKLNYTNYDMDVTNTDLNMLNKQTLGFYGGIGLSKYLSKHRSVSLMLQYQRSTNLLNLDYKDNATNRSRASMLLQGLSVQLTFRVF